VATQAPADGGDRDSTRRRASTPAKSTSTPAKSTSTPAKRTPRSRKPAEPKPEEPKHDEPQAVEPQAVEPNVADAKPVVEVSAPREVQPTFYVQPVAEPQL
jgi:hypothetical protein